MVWAPTTKGMCLKPTASAISCKVELVDGLAASAYFPAYAMLKCMSEVSLSHNYRIRNMLQIRTSGFLTWGAAYLTAALLAGGGCGSKMEMAEGQPNAACKVGQPLYRLSSSEDYVVSAVSLITEDSCALQPVRMIGWQGKVFGGSEGINANIIVPHRGPDFELGFLLQGSVRCNTGVLFSQSVVESNGCSSTISETALVDVQADDQLSLNITRFRTAGSGCTVPKPFCSTTYELQLQRRSVPTQ